MPKPKVAVILVPGIGGTHLEDPQGTIAWKVNNTLQMAGSHFVGYSENQADSLLKGSRFIIGPPKKTSKYLWDDVEQGTYKVFLEDCQNQKNLPFTPTVWAAGYNWTQSNSVSFIAILETTRKALQEPEIAGFIYVTHSMGALTTRALLKTAKTQHPEIFSKCIGVIHVAAPNDGAPEALLRFATGYKGTWKVAQVMGDEGWKFTTALAPVKAMYELFPHHPQGVITKGGWLKQDDPHNLSVSSPYFLNLIAAYSFKTAPVSSHLRGLSSARKFYADRLETKINNNTWSADHLMKFIEGYVFPLRTGAVCLTGSKTTISVKIVFNQKGEVEKVVPTYSDGGDGTVTLESQKKYIDDEENISIIRCNVDHGDALKEEGKKFGIFDAIYSLMKKFYDEYKYDK